MRLIDADRLSEVIYDNVSAIYEDAVCAKEDCLTEIYVAPTVDAVPVVRCRECNHCDPENYHCDHPMSTAAPLRRKPDDFCSYGEKRRDKDGTT